MRVSYPTIRKGPSGQEANLRNRPEKFVQNAVENGGAAVCHQGASELPCFLVFCSHGDHSLATDNYLQLHHFTDNRIARIIGPETHGIRP
jgi:hypothetical protein